MKAIIDAFPLVLNMSAIASIVIMFVLAARLLLRKAPKVFSYALWGIVLLRLLVPIQISSPVSAIPMIQTPSEAELNMALPDFDFETPSDRIENIQNLEQELEQGQLVHVTVSHTLEPAQYLSIVWLLGILCMLVYSLIAYLRIRKRIKIALPLRDNIFIADDIQSPFVIGFLRPRIYLPCDLSETEQEYIILHERHHIRRFDHILKLLAFLALTIHWFNPLVWLAFLLASRDMEMSCDEAVIRKMGAEVRADYAASLLRFATGRRILVGTPLAFGEGDTKGRIRNLANWKRPAFWVLLIAVILCIVLGVCLLTNPIEDNGENTGHVYYYGTVMDQAMSVVREGDRTGRSYITLRCDDGTEWLFWMAKGYENTEDFLGKYVQVRAMTEEGTGLSVTNDIEIVDKGVSTTLDDAIRKAVLDHNWSERYEGMFQCANFITLDEDTKVTADPEQPQKLIESGTVYGLAYYQVYRLEDGLLVEEGGSHIPTALTFRYSEGEFVLTEYWEPRDGTYYSDDIKAKFPAFVWPDTQKYILEQQLSCYPQALEHFRVGADVVAATVLEDICVNELWYDDAEKMLEADWLDTQVLIQYGHHTLEYCFGEFLKGGQTDLRGEIMALICQRIMEDWHEDFNGKDMKAQEWFDAYREYVLELGEEFDVYELNEDYPASFILLNMMDPGGKALDKTAPVFQTEGISGITFLNWNSKEIEAPQEDLSEITAWLGTFTVGTRAADYLTPGSNSIAVRITYEDATIIENGLSTVEIDGVTYYMDFAPAPQCYLDLVSE